MRTSSKRLLSAWLACCAILLNALVPTLSHAFAAARAPQHGWEICLNNGTTLSGTGQLDRATFLRLTDPGRPLAGDVVAASHGRHGEAGDPMADCAYCLPHAGSHGLPPTATPVLPAALAGIEKPYLFYHAPRPLVAWTAARPRGPPRYA